MKRALFIFCLACGGFSVNAEENKSSELDLQRQSERVAKLIEESKEERESVKVLQRSIASESQDSLLREFEKIFVE